LTVLRRSMTASLVTGICSALSVLGWGSDNAVRHENQAAWPHRPGGNISRAASVGP
jgi:hypothetical protein